MLIFKEVKDENEFNPLDISDNAPFTQSFFYGEWQQKLGRKVRRFVIKENSQLIAIAQVIKYL